jgi:hypothetical protein
MGNTQSSESPRRATQKLSKPRTNQRVSTIDAIDTTQYSNVYHVGRPLSAAPSGAPSRVPSRTYTGLSEAPSERIMSPVDGSKERERRLSGIVRSNTYKQDYTPRHSMVANSVHSMEQRSVSRTNSMVHGPGARSLTGDHTASLPARSRCSSFHYELPIPEPRSPILPDMAIPQVPPLPTRLQCGDSVEGADASPRSPIMQQIASAAITRNNSEASLYPPLRRRSIIQTPGVATRSPTPLNSRASFRRSLPPSPSVSRQSSVDTKARRHTLVPPQPKPFDPESRERVVTPCEEEYKQLGGMKFGSLRIVNGSPSPAQTSHRAQKQAESGSYFVKTTTDDEAGYTAKPKLVQPKPTSPVSSPMVASFDQVAWGDQDSRTAVKPSGNELAGPSVNNTRHSPLLASSPSSSSSPRLEVASKRTEYEDGLFEIEASPETEPEAMKSEVLNVKDVPLARPSATPMKHGDARKVTSTVTRSDSGFASTSSSNGSGKPLSKTDSGYGSSLSLRSLRRTQSRARSPKKKTSESGSKSQSPEDTERGSALPTDSPVEPALSSAGDEQSHSLSRGFSLLSPTKSIHFPSNALGLGILKPSKSREGPTFKRHSSHRSPTRAGAQDPSELLTSEVSTPEESRKQPRLQRFWHSSRRKSLPAKYDARGAHDPMPADSAHLGGQEFGDALLYPASATLRLEPSKATLKTIMSVSSVELLPAQDDVPTTPLPKMDTPPPRPKTSQTVHVQSKVASTATVTVAGTTSSRPSYRHARRSSASSNGTVTASQPQTPQQTPQLKSRSSAPSFLQVDPSLPGYALQAHVSRKGSKTPPPLSMRRHTSRSASKLRQEGQQVHQTRSSIPPSVSAGWQHAGIDRFRTHSPINETDPSTFRSYTYRVPESVHVGSVEASNYHQPQSTRQYHSGYRRGSTGQHMMGNPGLSASQTLVYDGQTVYEASHIRQSWGYSPSQSPSPESMRRPATSGQHYAVSSQPYQAGHALSSSSTSTRSRRGSLDPRWQSQAQAPPYRILHSYDSPAYRNTPIWS